MTWNQATIRDLRAQRGWSQVQLADLLGASSSSVTNWERGRENPKPHMQKRLDELWAALEDQDRGAWQLAPGSSVTGEPEIARIGGENGQALFQICRERQGICLPLTEAIIPAQALLAALE